jgi:hypothetical protein
VLGSIHAKLGPTRLNKKLININVLYEWMIEEKSKLKGVHEVVVEINRLDWAGFW